MLLPICLQDLIIGQIYIIEVHRDNYIIIHKGTFKGVIPSYILFEKVTCCYYTNKLNVPIGPPLFINFGNIKYYQHNINTFYIFYTMVKQAQQSMENRSIQMVLTQLVDDSFIY